QFIQGSQLFVSCFSLSNEKLSVKKWGIKDILIYFLNYRDYYAQCQSKKRAEIPSFFQVAFSKRSS
ncbi:MAG: hypothetical protein WAX20_06175, partial [Enterococcus aquimarinus]